MNLFQQPLARLPAVLTATADSRTGLHYKMAEGIFPKPVKLSTAGRAVAWPVREVNAVLEARVAGQRDDQVRALVARLHAARSEHSL